MSTFPPAPQEHAQDGGGHQVLGEAEATSLWGTGQQEACVPTAEKWNTWLHHSAPSPLGTNHKPGFYPYFTDGFEEDEESGPPS